MMAVVQLGGKQYLIKENDVLHIEKVETQAGDTFSVNHVLLINDGKETKIGTPYVGGASVSLKVIKTALADKVRTFKMKAKKRYKRLKGHRQNYSEVEVVAIK